MQCPTDLDPQPKLHPEDVSSVVWPVLRTIRCPLTLPPPPLPFVDVLESRRSDREMVTAPLREIVNAIAFATRLRATLANDAMKRTRRLSPSAGALHPLDVVLVDWRGASRLVRYDAYTHTLDVLARRAGHNDLDELRQAVDRLAPRARGTAVVLLGDAARVRANYENAGTLFWRDAGVLLQTLFLVATAFRLAFCPLGILGHEVARALDLEGRLTPAGVALIGRRCER